MDNNFQPQNFENQNFQPQPSTNFQPQPSTNFQPEVQPSIEMPSEPTPAKPKNKLKIPLIILIILTVGSLTFGIFEFSQNSTLKSEIADLKSKIENLEKPPVEPEKPESPSEKPYSGTLEYEFIDDNEPTTTYNVSLDYESGELSMISSTCGALADSVSCSNDEYLITLTGKELKKVWWITREENYDQESLTKALEMVAMSSEPEVDCMDSEDTDCNSIDYRVFGNSMLDDLLYEIYGEIACDQTPTTCDAEIEECEKQYDPTTFNCKAAQEIDYPYIEVDV